MPSNRLLKYSSLLFTFSLFLTCNAAAPQYCFQDFPVTIRFPVKAIYPYGNGQTKPVCHERPIIFCRHTLPAQLLHQPGEVLRYTVEVLRYIRIILLGFRFDIWFIIPCESPTVNVSKKSKTTQDMKYQGWIIMLNIMQP